MQKKFVILCSFWATLNILTTAEPALEKALPEYSEKVSSYKKRITIEDIQLARRKLNAQCPVLVPSMDKLFNALNTMLDEIATIQDREEKMKAIEEFNSFLDPLNKKMLSMYSKSILPAELADALEEMERQENESCESVLLKKQKEEYVSSKLLQSTLMLLPFILIFPYIQIKNETLKKVLYAIITASVPTIIVARWYYLYQKAINSSNVYELET